MAQDVGGDPGGDGWLTRLNAQARRIAEQIRMGGLEPEPQEVARRVTEEQARRAAQKRLAEQRRAQTANAQPQTRAQRGRVLGIRRETGSYANEVRRYAAQHGMTYNQARSNKTFQYWHAILHEEENKLLAGKRVSRDPRGLYALALRKLGYKSDTVYRVGESPKIGA